MVKEAKQRHGIGTAAICAAVGLPCTTVKTLERMRDARLRKLAGAGPFVSASLVPVRTRCGNANCRCARGERHEAHVLTRKERGKTVTVYVPKSLLPEAREWKRIRLLLAEISALGERIVRIHARTRRAAAQNKSRAVRTRP
jgi:hypothetical protein